ncbi:MAG: CoA transferase, partial [Alicyclobacillus sp.]|nr:CoA transferase [Alicyclobacillus sp.]
MSDSMASQSGMRGILDGVRILDFSQMKTGPMGTQLLGDLGADVIKIERLGEGDWERQFPAFGRYTETGASSFFLAMNRNKRSLAIDLKSPDARRIIYALASSADVVVQNFRPGVLDKLGFGYRDFVRIRPDIIYCSNSGYGQTGPYRTRPGQDLLAQATSGMIMMNGTDDQPIPVATTVADGVTSMILALAILGALVHRLRTGEGQEVDVDLMTSLVVLQQEEVSAFLNLRPRPDFRRSASGVPAPWLSAPYGIYRTQDNKYLAIAMTPLDRLGNLIGVPELERFSGIREAFEFRDEARALIEERIRTRPREEWLRRRGAFFSRFGPLLRSLAARRPFIVCLGNNDLYPNYDTSPESLEQGLLPYRQLLGSNYYLDDLGHGIYPRTIAGSTWITLNSMVFSPANKYEGRPEQARRTLEWL